MPHPITLDIVRLFQKYGQDKYGSEAVSQLQHALQTASFAKRQGADSTLVAAALLHDIGHIIDGQSLPKSDTEDLDDAHENRAFQWLKSNFGIAVADPVRLHVAAKRFLCTTDPDYETKLSPTSLKSYYDQGGPMNQSELDDFKDERFAYEAVQLRRWDDLAKDPNMSTPSIEDFMPLLDSLLPQQT